MGRSDIGCSNEVITHLRDLHIRHLTDLHITHLRDLHITHVSRPNDTYIVCQP